MGNGRYADKLSYKDWFDFNVAQRIHYHYLESVTPVVCWLLIGGIYYPQVSASLGAAYILGRIIFHIGYSLKGPQGRVIGFILQFLATFALCIVSIISAFNLGMKNLPK